MGKTATAAVPKAWPAGQVFLTRPQYSASLTAAQLVALRTRPDPAKEVLEEMPLNLPRGPCINVKIVAISDATHPANGQYGLFAVRDLPAGSLILPYLGELHPGTGAGAEAAAKSDYDLWLCRAADVAVDAARAGNEARFINDYRGVSGRKSQGPNAEFREVWDGRPGSVANGERGIAVFVRPATKKQKLAGKGSDAGIRKGEEILVSYGKGFWSGRACSDEAESLEAD
jgi:xeroderma pigmentosum group C-complementing protein